MIGTIFDIVGSAVRGVRHARSGLMKAFALAACPAAEKEALDLCYKKLGLFENRIVTLASAKDERLWDIAEVLEMAVEGDDSLNDVAEFFAEEPLADLSDYPRDLHIVKHAKDYLTAFEALSAPTQARVLRSLYGHASDLMDHVSKAIEEIEDEEDNRFDNIDPGPPSPRP